MPMFVFNNVYRVIFQYLPQICCLGADHYGDVGTCGQCRFHRTYEERFAMHLEQLLGPTHAGRGAGSEEEDVCGHPCFSGQFPSVQFIAVHLFVYLV